VHSEARTRDTLRTLRRRRGLTQAQLAAKSGVSRTQITDAESGARSLSSEAARKLAPALGGDWLGLYLTSNITALKARVQGGQERPVRAASLARTLVEILQTDDLSPSQRRTLREGLEELVDFVEGVAQERGSGTLAGLAPPSRAAEDSVGRSSFQTDYSARYEQDMASLGRDVRGRRKTPSRGGDSVDLNQDYLPESGEERVRFVPRKPKTSRKSSEQTTYEALDRDNFGRRKHP
jgi:transcriptional regulator with XRE-family HTH domain